MIRILFVSTSTTVGGAEKTLYTLATLLDPARFKVAGVVSLKPLGEYAHKLSQAGIPVFTLDMKGRPGLKHLRRLREIMKETGPHLVHALMYQAIQLCRAAKKRAPHPIKLISSPRVSYRTRSYFTLALDRLLKGADDLLISECRSSRDYLVGRLGYDPARVRTIYNGVDIAGWPSSKLERRQKRLELRLTAEEFLIGTTGRLDDQKGHPVLIRAVHLLKGQPLRCAILGEGPGRPALEKLIRRHHLERQVWLLGQRDDVTTWLSALDLFVLPSLWEGLPNSLLEAMAMGLPVVATAVDGVAEVIEDGKNGLLVPPRDPKALSRKILQLLQDPAARARLGEAAQKTITDRFGVLDMISSYEKTYAEVASTRP